MSFFQGLFKRETAVQAPASLVPKTDELPVFVYPLLSAEALLTPRVAHINRIEELAGLPERHFRRYYLNALENYAGFVQQLPASEQHHHAHAGGLLDHTLEVIIHALTLRQGYLLPLGTAVEALVHTKDVWTYGVFAAALCHDLAKPALDQKIELIDVNGQSLGFWDPFAGDIAQNRNIGGYRIEFVRNRSYRLHEQAALLFVHRILPTAGLAWLATDRHLFSAWCACVSGDASQADVLGEIIGLSDQTSVSKNLGAERPLSAAAKSHVIPLHAKLLTALRQLLEENALPLNRNGAAGWRKGNQLWLVSKRAVDSMRLQLNQTGHTGIPSDNQRIFDILQEQHILELNQDRAIWRMTVQAEQWSHEFTLICIPLIKIWPDPSAWPGEFMGTITNTKESERMDSENIHTNGIPQSPSITKSANEVSSIDDNAAQCIAHDPSAPSPNLNSSGDDFIDWVVSSLEQRTIEYNQPGARIHVVEEGVLLVTPGIFKDYVSRRAESQNWEDVQKRFFKLKLHERTKDDLNVFKYHVSGQNRTNQLGAILIKDVNLFFKTIKPTPNPFLVSSS